MYVVVVYNSLSEYREHQLCQLTGDNFNYDIRYLYKDVKNYNSSFFLKNAKVWSTQSGAQRIVDDFLKDNENSFTSSYFWLSDKFLAVKKLTIQEWYEICDEEAKKVKYEYERKCRKIEQKRKSYK